MTQKTIPCLHCALIRTINAHVTDNGIKVAPGSEDAFALHGQITADLMRVIEEHINEGDMIDKDLRREMWRALCKWTFTRLLDHTTLKDLVDSMTAQAADPATVKH